ncbi:MAG: hypothetical protein K8S99_15740 [Planctomycetes bacterium]|nr:hypothetical protein [Planctomycetota bacterium]
MHTTVPSMTHAHDAPETGRAEVFLPPERMLRYQWAKVTGAAFFIVIFGSWLYIQWSSPVMRTVAMLLVVLTVWYTLRSIIGDVARSRGRLISLSWRPDAPRDDADLLINTPTGVTTIPVRDIASARWSEEDDADFGLWLLDRDDKPLAHLDAWFVDHQEEARTLLNWARKHTRFEFPIHWPETA